MCRRNIEPRLGLWTFPAGFMELGESSAQGAAREAMEEAQVDVQVDDLLMVINVPYVSQVYLIHRGTMRGDHFGPTFESSEVRLRSEEHTSELQSLMRISYAVFCLKKKNTNKQTTH